MEKEKSDTLIVQGGFPLSGTIDVSGSKNASLALIPASMLGRGKVILQNVPLIDDIIILCDVIKLLGVKVEFKDDELHLDSTNIVNIPLTDPKVSALRASTYFMGVCLSLFNEVRIIAPGGCKIGERPIDYHLQAFKELGVEVKREDNTYHLFTTHLKEAIITLPYPSVGTTINILLASFNIDGITIIENVALEPEVDQVIDLLNALGANISGKGQGRLLITPRNKINSPVTFKVIPDRIEAGTYAILGALLGDKLKIRGFDFEHGLALLNVFKKLGVEYILEEETLIISRSDNLNPITLKTYPYPYFPTDLQQPLTVLLSRTSGLSSIEDTVYKKRLSHLEELKKLHFNVKQSGYKIFVDSSLDLIPGIVEGKDLRGSAALLLALLCIPGESKLSGYKYIKRGYYDVINKLQQIGGRINEE